MKIFSSEQSRKLERRAVEDGATLLGLMQKAGEAAARVIQEKCAVNGKRVTVLCGKGNNGGDGYVAAVKLRKAGASVQVFLLEGQPKASEASFMFQRLQNTPVKVIDVTDNIPILEEAIEAADIIIDAIYGTGFHGSLQGNVLKAAERVNASRAAVFAMDIPSGAQCDTGCVEGTCICANCTVAFSTLKPVHVLYPSRKYCGETVVADIGIVSRLIDSQPATLLSADDNFIKNTLPVRDAEGNKGTYGKLASFCGSYGMAGAAVLSSKAALRCGAGLVNLCTPYSIYPIIASQLAEPIFTPMQQNVAGTLSFSCKDIMLDRANWASACLFGCGLGNNRDIASLLDVLLQNSTVPLVLDADGINALAGHIDRVKSSKAPVILTPHPGEMARLLHTDVSQVQSNRVQCAREFAEAYGVILVLKGAGTVIASPDGQVYVNRTGNPGMATGGSGDVLAGMIASFAAQGIDPLNAAVCAVYLHGQAGDRCAARLSQTAMLPTDIINELPGLFSEYER